MQPPSGSCPEELAVNMGLEGGHPPYILVVLYLGNGQSDEHGMCH